MKAIHKYKLAASRGDKEAQRRIAQSMGYRTTIHDMPHMILLLHRAGIDIPGYEFEEVNDDLAKGQGGQVVDTITL